MKHVLTLLALTFALGGCVTMPEAPPEIKVPVPVACKTPEPNQPTYRFQPPYDNVFDATRDLMGDRETALGYENQLRTALQSCK